MGWPARLGVGPAWGQHRDPFRGNPGHRAEGCPRPLPISGIGIALADDVGVHGPKQRVECVKHIKILAR